MLVPIVRPQHSMRSIKADLSGATCNACIRQYTSAYVSIRQRMRSGATCNAFSTFSFMTEKEKVCPYSTIYESSYKYIMCSHTTRCVLILVYMCPHATVYVSSYYYMYVLILLYMCSYYNICVLILLHMFPHTTIYVSSYYTCSTWSWKRSWKSASESPRM